MAPEQSNPSSRDLYARGMVYDAIARLLPLEGRDFRVALQTDPELRVKIEGITELGTAFARHCSLNLQRQLGLVASEKAEQRDIVDKVIKLKEATNSGRTNIAIGRGGGAKRDAGIARSRHTSGPAEQPAI